MEAEINNNLKNNNNKPLNFDKEDLIKFTNDILTPYDVKQDIIDNFSKNLYNYLKSLICTVDKNKINESTNNIEK